MFGGLTVLAVSLISIVVFGVGAAIAANVNGYRAGPNSTVDFGQVNLTIGFHDALHYVDENAVEPTHIQTILHHHGGTEVEVFDADYGSSAYGWYECHSSYVSGGKVVCTQSHVHINLSASPPGGTWSDVERGSLMCEEIGHALGLAHDYTANGQFSCMGRPVNWNIRDFNAEHDDLILNGMY